MRRVEAPYSTCYRQNVRYDTSRLHRVDVLVRLGQLLERILGSRSLALVRVQHLRELSVRLLHPLGLGVRHQVEDLPVRRGHHYAPHLLPVLLLLRELNLGLRRGLRSVGGAHAVLLPRRRESAEQVARRLLLFLLLHLHLLSLQLFPLPLLALRLLLLGLGLGRGFLDASLHPLSLLLSRGDLGFKLGLGLRRLPLLFL
mmetsp:Transcript_8547/g.34526  ORF Transcript_8547/g.34526 Transcript_8547/m.34526 type:complete len:200 (-) Transcript_8547:529-1128(-)